MRKLLLIFAVSVFLIGCGETEEKIEDINKDHNERAGTVSHEDKYDFELDGDGNVYRLADKIEEIEITGNGNYITVESDALIDTLIITGNNNVVDTEDNHDATIVDVEVNGINNIVRLYDIANLIVDDTNTIIQTSN